METPTIIEHYQSHGYAVHGLGGVQFFDPSNAANMLPRMFDEFEYHGTASGEQLSSTDIGFTAEALETLLTNHQLLSPFFVFANLSETHFPYLSPSGANDDETSVALGIMRTGAVGKRIAGFDHHELRTALAAAHRRQVQALEWIDDVFGRILEVLSALPRSTLVVVCADHGDSFGERGMIGHGHPAPEVMDVPMWVGRTAASD